MSRYSFGSSVRKGIRDVGVFKDEYILIWLLLVVLEDEMRCFKRMG